MQKKYVNGLVNSEQKLEKNTVKNNRDWRKEVRAQYRLLLVLPIYTCTSRQKFPQAFVIGSYIKFFVKWCTYTIRFYYIE